MNDQEPKESLFLGKIHLAKLMKQIFIISPDDVELYMKYLGNFGILVPDAKYVAELKEDPIEDLIDELYLRIESRLKLVAKLSALLLEESAFPPDFMAISLVQSFCAILLVDLNTLPAETITAFVAGFQDGARCLPLQRQICADLSMHFMWKLFEVQSDTLFTQLFGTAMETMHLFSHQLGRYATEIQHGFVMLTERTRNSELMLRYVKFINEATNWALVRRETKPSENKMVAILCNVLEQMSGATDECPLFFGILSVLFHYVDSRTDEIEIISNTVHRFLGEERVVWSFPHSPSDPRLRKERPKMEYFKIVKDLVIEDRMISHYVKRMNEFVLERSDIVTKFLKFLDTTSGIYGESMFEVFFAIARPWLSEGNLELVNIILGHVIEQKRYKEQIGSFCDMNPVWHSLFTSGLFEPSTTMFADDPSPAQKKILALRIYMFDVLHELMTNKEQSDGTFSAILMYLNSIVDQCHVFTEIVFLISVKLLDVISRDSPNFITFVDIIANEIAIQQLKHVKGDQYASKYRPLMFRVLGKLGTLATFSEMIFNSPSFLCSFFSILCEPDIFDLHFDVFRTLAIPYFMPEPGKSWSHFEHAMEMFMNAALEQIDNPHIVTIVSHVFMVIQFFVSQPDGQFARLFANSPLINLLYKIFTDAPIGPESLQFMILTFNILALMCQMDVVGYNEVPWNSFIPLVKAVEVTKDLMCALQMNVCLPNNHFTVIKNSCALPLLVLGMHGTQFFEKTLDNVYSICCNSMWNCFECFKSGLLPKLLEMITESLDSNITELILKIFSVVNWHVSSRHLFFMFTRVIEPIEGKYIQPYLEKFTDTFRMMLIKSRRVPHAFIHFSSMNECLEFRGLTAREMQNGFTISMWMLLDAFPNKKNAFSLLHFKNSDLSFHIFATSEALWVSSRNHTESLMLHSVPMDIPVLTWFNLTLSISIEHGLRIYINGTKQGEIEESFAFMLRDYDVSRIMSGYEDPQFPTHWMRHGQLSMCAIFAGSMSKKLPKRIYDIGTDSLFRIRHDSSLLGLYTAQKTKQQLLLNMGDEIYLEDARFSGTACNSIASFLQVFESSNGVAYVTTLWSMLLLKYRDEKQVNVPDLISWLSGLFLTLIQVSELSQSQMVQNDSYAVIAHFLRSVDPSFLSIKVWHHFWGHFQVATNDSLKIDITRKVLFNSSLWTRLNQVDAAEVFKQWHLFFQTIDFRYWKHVTIPYMLNVIDDICNFAIMENKDVNDMELLLVINSICLAIFDIADHRFTPDDSASILTLCMKRPYPTIVNTLLKLLIGQFTYGKAKSQLPTYLNSIITYTPMLFLLCENCSRIELINLVELLHEAVQDKNVLFLFIYEIQREGKYMMTNGGKYNLSKEAIQNGLDFLVVSLCELATGVSSDSFNLAHHVENEKVVSPFHLCYSYTAALEASDSLKPIFADFMAGLSSDQENQKAIAKYAKELDIFVITYYSMIVDPMMIPVLASILVHDMALYQTAMDVILSLETLLMTDLHPLINSLLVNMIPFVMAFDDNEKCVAFVYEFTRHAFFQPTIIDKELFEGHKAMASVEGFSLTLHEVVDLLENANVPKERLPLSISVLSQQQIANTSVIKVFLQMLLGITSNDPKSVQPMYISILLHYCTLARDTDFDLIYPNIIQIMKNCPEVCYDPLFVNICQNRYAIPNEFWRYVPSRTPTIEMYGKTTQMLYEYSQNQTVYSPLVSTSRITKELYKLIKSRPSMQYVLDTSQMEDEDDVVESRSWTQLYTKLMNERSPLFKKSLTEGTRHYKMTSYIDHRFRPTLLHPVKSFQNSPSDEQRPIMKIWSAKCIRTSVRKSKKGTFYVTGSAYKFCDKHGKVLIIPGMNVTHILWRWDLMIPNSVEIFTWDHHSFLFTFPKETSHAFVAKLMRTTLPRYAFVQTHPSHVEFANGRWTERWLEHSISTFDYIMALNMFSGRSFNNIANYPVFPWVLCDYDNDESDPELMTYRKMDTPIGAFNEHALAKRKEQIESDEQEKSRRFLYSTGYSNSMIVSHYMVRIQPFSDIHVQIQDGHFDTPNRLFQSISESWSRLITSGSSYRELVPEFFFMPEIFINVEQFDFGRTQAGNTIGDVKLPNWSSSAPDFVHKHMRCLESDVCGEKISDWIDLIWGYKQTGEAAVLANNTFDPLMYATGCDTEDALRGHTLALIGQIPIQLFTEPHPRRKPFVAPPLADPLHFPVCESPVVALQVVGGSLEDLKVYALHKNGKCSVSKKGKTQILCDQGDILAVEPKLISARETLFNCATNDGTSVAIFSPSKKRSLKCDDKPHIASISCVESSRRYIISGGNDSMVALWGRRNGVTQVISQSVVHNETISCVALSEEYGIAVSCSRDGQMSVFTIPTLDFVRSVDLELPENMIPNKLVICHGMGYICVFCDDEMSKFTIVKTFTLNGLPLKSERYEYTYLSAITIVDHRGMDLLLVLKSDNTIELMDAFTLETVRVLYKSTNKITFIQYQKAYPFIVACEAGKCFTVIPIGLL